MVSVSVRLSNTKTMQRNLFLSRAKKKEHKNYTMQNKINEMKLKNR